MGSYYFFPGEKAKQLWVPDIFLDKTPNIRWNIKQFFIFLFFVKTKCKKVT